METKTLSPFGIAVASFKKASVKFDKNVSSGIEYEMMKLIEADAKKRVLFDLRMEIIESVQELMRQYRHLYQDYYRLNHVEEDNENCFDNITNNESSAYNKAKNMLQTLHNTPF